MIGRYEYHNDNENSHKYWEVSDLGNGLYEIRWGRVGAKPQSTQYDMAKTAKRTIITCEKIVETEDIIRAPLKAQIPMQKVDAVVKVPFGAHPSSCFPFYTFDPVHIQKYLQMDYAEYNKDYISLKDNADYLEKIGGIRSILNIMT